MPTHGVKEALLPQKVYHMSLVVALRHAALCSAPLERVLRTFQNNMYM